MKNEKQEKQKKELFIEEGQLAIDIYQTENKLIIQSAIAGVKEENLDITIEKDLIVIRGRREEPIIEKKESEKKDYFIQECYWGPFSRKIILPVEINPDNVEASMKDGILIIKLTKILKEKKRKIEVK
jgi:HSP20 family protein